MALAESAVGDLPGLGDVLAGYQGILQKLEVDGDVLLPGVYELGRADAMDDSPIRWKDSGDLCVVRQVPGGSVNPGKVVSGLARAAERSGALLFEHSAVTDIQFSDSITLHTAQGAVPAAKVLFATNAFALDLNRMHGRVQPAFTTALMTETLGDDLIAGIGLAERKPFYTVDLPYLWGRFLGDAIIFGAGLVFVEESEELNSIDVDEGETLELFEKLERRIVRFHPRLHHLHFTHRWGGPICFAEDWKPVFEYHPESKNAVVLGAFAGHGVAQSVYMGAWAAEVLLGKREVPHWN